MINYEAGFLFQLLPDTYVFTRFLLVVLVTVNELNSLTKFGEVSGNTSPLAS